MGQDRARTRDQGRVNARLFLLTEWIFVGIITLGLMGFVCDRVLRLVANTLLKRYDVKM